MRGVELVAFDACVVPPWPYKTCMRHGDRKVHQINCMKVRQKQRVFLATRNSVSLSQVT